MKKHTLVFTFAAIAGLTMAQSAAAQVDPRLERWIGCWRLEDDLAGTGARLCITPEKNGVRMQTIAGTHRGTEEMVIPDGIARPIVDTECKGTEQAEWSRNGQRVFRTTEVTCKDETPRTIKGIAFLAGGNSLVNVQHVSGEGATPNVRVQRYRRAANQKLADGTPVAQPRSASAPIDPTWTIDDVIEASGRLPAEALQGALVDVKQKFNVNRKTLVAMDDAGVPDSIVDLMVALTFPNRFVVERVTSSAPVGISTGMGWYDPFMSPLMTGMYGSCYTPGGYYGYRSYYNMCGPYMYGYNYFPYSNYYRGDNYYYGGGGGWVPIDNTGGGGTVVTASGHGRVVNGQGYTQIRERTPEPSVPRVSSRGDGSASGWSGASSSGGVSSSGYSSGGSSSSSGASSGSSSGGSSGGGDRVAVPRPGGGS